jgi:hypothetical protein
MNVSTTGRPALCTRCGQIAADGSGGCPHCGSPLTGARRTTAPSVSTAALAPAGPVYRFAPPPAAARPRLSRRNWLVIGASLAVVVLGVAAFLVLRPESPSPAKAVRDYFADLGKGDTTAALTLADNEGLSSPLLVPAALANAADRPTDAAVTSARAPQAGGSYAAVSVTYKVGGQALQQTFAVVKTTDKKVPYRLVQPYVALSVQAPDAMPVTVNGIQIDTDSLYGGVAAFPGRYSATTGGNALFAGATQAATYDAGGEGVTAAIEFGPPAVAPGAAQAVQTAVQQYIDTNCSSSYSGQCPVDVPYESYDQTVNWTFSAYPQVQLGSPEQGQSEVPFTTGTPGSARYTITYSDYYTGTKTVSGTAPINVNGYAQLGNDGAITVSLGY